MSGDDPLRRRFAASAPLMAEQTASQADELGDRVARFAGLVGTERVLDAGTGTGTLALGIASHAGEVVGVDLVPSSSRRRGGSRGARGTSPSSRPTSSRCRSSLKGSTLRPAPGRSTTSPGPSS